MKIRKNTKLTKRQEMLSIMKKHKKDKAHVTTKMKKNSKINWLIVILNSSEDLSEQKKFLLN